MGWLRAVYRAAEPSAVTLGTVPEGRVFSLVMTHDIDAQNSLKNSITYAQYEKSRGVRATYFVQVKYIKDWNDIALIDRRTAGYLYELNSLGMEVASHSVCHSFVFETFPEGSGAERYPGYRPFVFNKMTTRGDRPGRIEGQQISSGKARKGAGFELPARKPEKSQVPSRGPGGDGLSLQLGGHRR
jgi:hypothetical protein